MIIDGQNILPASSGLTQEKVVEEQTELTGSGADVHDRTLELQDTVNLCSETNRQLK
jgi:hypothetical protein